MEATEEGRAMVMVVTATATVAYPATEATAKEITNHRIA